MSYEDAKHERKPDGFILVDDVEVAVSRKCIHCGGHFVSVRGSGVQRGWCMSCAGVTCGGPGCDVCCHWEEKLARIERRASREFRLGV